jgi:hypothetical protein
MRFQCRVCGRGLLGGIDDRGPIFHAKDLQRKDRGASTVCVTPASRRGERQDYLSEFYIRFKMIEEKNVIEITGLIGKTMFVL